MAIVRQVVAIARQVVAIVRQVVAIARQVVAIARQVVAIVRQGVAIARQVVAIARQVVAIARQVVAIAISGMRLPWYCLTVYALLILLTSIPAGHTEISCHHVTLLVRREPLRGIYWNLQASALTVY